MSGQILPSQMTRIARAYEIEVMTELGPLEEKEVYVRKKDKKQGTVKKQEFYLLHNGIVLKGNRGNVGIAIKDAPLVVFGNLESKPIRLCDGNNWILNRALPYSWTMNNYWETNFKVDLGGFYEFAYSLSLTGQEGEKETMGQCREVNEGILGFYIS